MPNRLQAIIWINVGMLYWRIYASLGLNDFSQAVTIEISRVILAHGLLDWFIVHWGREKGQAYKIFATHTAKLHLLISSTTSQHYQRQYLASQMISFKVYLTEQSSFTSWISWARNSCVQLRSDKVANVFVCLISGIRLKKNIISNSISCLCLCN